MAMSLHRLESPGSFQRVFGFLLFRLDLLRFWAQRRWMLGGFAHRGGKSQVHLLIGKAQRFLSVRLLGGGIWRLREALCRS